MVELGKAADTVGEPQIVQQRVVGRVMELTIENVRGRSLAVKPALTFEHVPARPFGQPVESRVRHEGGDSGAFVSFGGPLDDHRASLVASVFSNAASCFATHSTSSRSLLTKSCTVTAERC